MEAFENLQFESEVYFKLQEAEREAELIPIWGAGLSERYLRFVSWNTKPDAQFW
ncbi:MAG: hypothetical protein V8Q23_00320 [Eubacteriales bacterium]